MSWDNEKEMNKYKEMQKERTIEKWLEKDRKKEWKTIEYTFFSLKIINKNIHKNILEILDQNRISIEVTFLYFSTNQLKP